MEQTTDSFLLLQSFLPTVHPVLRARVRPAHTLHVLLSVERIARTRSHQPSTSTDSIRSGRESRCS